MKLLCVILMVFSFNLCFAQQDFNGYWKGKITQEEGGYTPEYSFELFIIQKGDSITGRSYVYIDSIYAEMNIKGEIQNGIDLVLKDEKMLNHEELREMDGGDSNVGSLIQEFVLRLNDRRDTLLSLENTILVDTLAERVALLLQRTTIRTPAHLDPPSPTY